MQEITLGSYRLRVDVAGNRAYYGAHSGPWITCECAGCRNFVQAVKQLPAAVSALFETLGLDPEKPAELCYYAPVPQGLSGGGWYHLCGELLSGGMPPGSYEVYGEWVELAEGFSVGFKTACDLLPDDFPRPCFQMEWNHCLPWVLEEPNPY